MGGIYGSRKRRLVLGNGDKMNVLVMRQYEMIFIPYFNWASSNQ